MLIHIGEGCLIRDRSVIGFFDMDGSARAEDTVQFLRKAEKEGIVEMLTTDIPRSMVLTEEKIYITRISTGAIRNRAAGEEEKRSPAGKGVKKAEDGYRKEDTGSL